MTTLSEAHLTELQNKRFQALVDDIGYWEIYKWLADLLQSSYGVPASDPSVRWLRGATEANAGRGAFSELIRRYTETQGSLRYADTQSALIQPASDAVALNLISDLLGESADWLRGVVPDVARIAVTDASAVGLVLFGPAAGHNAADTAFEQNSA